MITTRQPKDTTQDNAPDTAYYEAWGDLANSNAILRSALWISATVALLSLLLLRLQIRRPPVVITIDGEGQAQVIPDPGRQPAVSEPEIRNFLSLFEMFYTELNFFNCEQQLNLALGMMTPDFRAKAAEEIKRKMVVETLKSHETKTNLVLAELKIVQDGPDSIQCRITGTRAKSSDKDGGVQGTFWFEDTVTLRKISRSEQAPNGVLVEYFNGLESPIQK